ncbi:MAG TPA: protein translocase subunit SecD [Candidatus Polarisedimenticolaceae bacterium]|nr:protein translocase subunit SecD [Candidatus Polarisedimenticolaceae bacterium]
MSNSPLFWKFALILAVVAAAAAFCFPPQDRINLGLDLKGGAHILMQVDTDSAIKFEMDRLQNSLGQRFKSEGIGYEAILPAGEATLEIRGTSEGQRAQVRDELNQFVGGWDHESVGQGTWRLTMPGAYRSQVEVEAVDTTLATIRRRIDSLGVSDPTIQKSGIDGRRILVQLPGIEDPTRVKELLKDPAVLEWKEVSYPPGSDFENYFPPASQEAVIAQFGGELPADTELFPQRIEQPDGTTIEAWWPLKRVSTVAGRDLRDARRSADEWGDPAVSFELTQEAGKRFEIATRENLGRKMAIVLGGADSKTVISAPVIEGIIRDQGVIRGGFDVQRADDLAIKLRSGAIPTDVTILEERTVGPSLGRDSIRSGLAAGLAGFLGVMLFMLAYYRLSGINAVIALALNVLLVFGALGALPFLFSAAGIRATLTLPGIAGLILVIGMAVDSNVLVFERIREELQIGKTVRSAVDQGFAKAFSTILDCNVTTVVAAIFLSVYGTGPVRGFAVTLIIGLIASMFTAVFVSRQLFELVLLKLSPDRTLSI